MFNEVIAINKKEGFTSHDVVARLRSLLSQKRIGHAGTLDPFATGVLVIGLGQATKLLEYFSAEKKTYVATFIFGEERATDDMEGEIVQDRRAVLGEKVEFSSLFDAALRSCIDGSFAKGEIAKLKKIKTQLPPAFSAVSVEGVRSYKTARTQEKADVEKALEPRPVEIFKAELLQMGTMEVERPQGTPQGDLQGLCGSKKLPFWTVELEVSKGTYIRSIARDLGRALGVGGFVQKLERVSSGSLSLEDCLSLEEIEREKKKGLLKNLLQTKAVNLYDALDLPFRYLSPFEFRKVQTGSSILNKDAVYRGENLLPQAGQRVALFNEQGLWGIWKAKDEISLVCEKNFAKVVQGLEVPYVL